MLGLKQPRNDMEIQRQPQGLGDIHSGGSTQGPLTIRPTVSTHTGSLREP